MLNKIWKYFIFLYYTWIIFLSPVLIGYLLIICPVYAITMEDFSIIFIISKIGDLLLFLLGMLGLPFWLPVYTIELMTEIKAPVTPGHIFYFSLYLIIFLAIIFLVYFVPLHLWWTRQTIPRAALLAIASTVAGAGAPFFWQFFFNGKDYLYILILPGVILFYLLLYIANKWQKQHYPNCKIANKIRFILKWPCLRT